MIRLFRLFFIGILLLQSFLIKAQTSDHLEPVGSIFGIEFNYHNQVRKILLNGISDYQVIQLVVLPSNGKENVLAIELDTIEIKNKKYFLVYHECKESIWNSIILQKQFKEIEVEKYRIEIEEKSVEIIKNLFNTALSQTKYEERLCLDCVQYIFSTTFGLKSGRTRILGINNNETKMSKLVEIGNELIQLAKTSNEKVEFDSKFFEKIETLIKEFN
jgi:hypothetical protein